MFTNQMCKDYVCENKCWWNYEEKVTGGKAKWYTRYRGKFVNMC